MTPEQLKRVQDALEMCRRVVEPLMDDLHDHFNLPPDALQMAMSVTVFGKPGFVATDIEDPLLCAKLLAEAAQAILSARRPRRRRAGALPSGRSPHVHELTRRST